MLRWLPKQGTSENCCVEFESPPELPPCPPPKLPPRPPLMPPPRSTTNSNPSNKLVLKDSISRLDNAVYNTTIDSSYKVTKKDFTKIDVTKKDATMKDVTMKDVTMKGVIKLDNKKSFEKYFVCDMSGETMNNESSIGKNNENASQNNKISSVHIFVIN